MENIKATNKKLVMIIVALALTVLALIGTVIGVFAASSHGFGAGFSISYDIGGEVIAKVRISYQIGSKEAVIVQGHNYNTNSQYAIDAEGWTYFNAGDESETLDPDTPKPEEPSYDIALNATNPTVTFLFEMENMVDDPLAAGVDFMAELSGTISPAFNYTLYRRGGTSLAQDWEQVDSFEELTTWTTMWGSIGESIEFKVVLTVADVNQPIMAEEINANFALTLS